jgi:hypothetical protein
MRYLVPLLFALVGLVLGAVEAPACPPVAATMPALTFQQPVQLAQQYTVAQPTYQPAVQFQQFEPQQQFAAPAPVFTASAPVYAAPAQVFAAPAYPVALPVRAGGYHYRDPGRVLLAPAPVVVPSTGHGRVRFRGVSRY